MPVGRPLIDLVPFQAELAALFREGLTYQELS